MRKNVQRNLILQIKKWTFCNDLFSQIFKFFYEAQKSWPVISWEITYKFNGFGKRNRIHARIHKFAKWEFEFSQVIWKNRRNYTNYFPFTALLEWIDMTSHKQDKSKKRGLKDGMSMVQDEWVRNKK